MAKLYFRYGAMNSGKTTAIIQVAHNYEERGMKILLLKPAIDTKWAGAITSRLGVGRVADIQVQRGENMMLLLDLYQKRHGPVDCILVDEVQFFDTHQIDDFFWIAVDKNIPVICYGLRSDFLLESFPASARLMTLAHTIEELKTICRCGKKAVCNMRLEGWAPVFSWDQIAIDGVEVSYESVCGSCYAKYKNATVRNFEDKYAPWESKPKSKRKPTASWAKKETQKAKRVAKMWWKKNT